EPLVVAAVKSVLAQDLGEGFHVDASFFGAGLDFPDFRLRAFTRVHVFRPQRVELVVLPVDFGEIALQPNEWASISVSHASPPEAKIAERVQEHAGNSALMILKKRA